MRTGVAACSVHGLHRGKLVAVKGFSGSIL